MKKGNKILLGILALIAVMFVGYVTLLENKPTTPKGTNVISSVTGNEANDEAGNEASSTSNSDKIKIYYFDVGQADSILLTSKDETMLIDAGTNSAGKNVVKNIKDLGIKKIDYVVGTHPHEDHIGGMDDVINNFEIGKIFMPKIQTNTKTFEDVLDAISNKGLKIDSPEKGEKFKVGYIDCEIMLDNSVSEKEAKKNLNLSSIVIRATYGEQSYLFMGDAEETNESLRDWPQTNVLKVGHHGSNSSSSKSFLNKVKPKISIISVGKGNTYGHPTAETLKKLNNIGSKIYRTDENGTIIIESDGKTNNISTSK